ncbi:MAG: DNA (cytosine-5-)-methyltransferase [Lachnospiraceae bacterium]
MKFIDLFSGIGGFRRGLERSGHKAVGHVEIDNFANKSYMAMYDLTPCKFSKGNNDNGCMMCSMEVEKNCDGKNCKGEWYRKDIKRIGAEEIPKAEIWTFGFPCTDISLSGKRAGLSGERSGLFFEVTRLLKGQSAENKPRWIIVENVKHLLSIERGGAFTTVLSELSQIGYDCQWQVLGSKSFGVPQHRERVYLVGHLRGTSGREIFPLGRTNKTPVKQVVGGSQGNRIYDPTGLSVTLVSGAGGFGGKTGLYAVPSFVDMNENTVFTDTARCIRARQNAGITNHKGEVSGVIVPQCCCRKNKDNVRVSSLKDENSGIFLCHGNPNCVRAVITPDRVKKRQNGRRFKEDGEPSFTLTCQDRHGVLLCGCEHRNDGYPIREAKSEGHTMAYHGDGINLAYPNSKVSRGRVGRGCSQTILTGGSMGVMLCCRIRRLTPRECFRLQAFDDFLFDRAKAAGISDAQLYKQAGNAVTVNIVYEIGLKLYEEVEDAV